MSPFSSLEFEEDKRSRKAHFDLTVQRGAGKPDGEPMPLVQNKLGITNCSKRNNIEQPSLSHAGGATPEAPTVSDGEHHISSELHKKASFLLESAFLSSHGQYVMKIVDDGTTGNYQHRENTVGVIEHTRFNLPKPIQIGMGKGSCLASTGVLVEDVTPHHADPSVGVVEVVQYLNPDGWKLEISLKSPKVMLKSNIDVCAQNRNKYAPFCLSRSTYSTDGTAPTTHDCVDDLPDGTVATRLQEAPNGLLLYKACHKAQFQKLVSARTGQRYDQALEIAATRANSRNGSSNRAAHVALVAMGDPRNPSVWVVTLRAVLFAFGLLTEASADFRMALADKGYRIVIVAVSEILPEANALAMRLKPVPMILGDGTRFDEWGDRIPEHDIQCHSWSCLERTSLKQSIGYGTTQLAKHYTDVQPAIIEKYKPRYLISENTNPNQFNHSSASKLIRRLEPDYLVSPNVVDACCLGDKTAHVRDIILGCRREVALRELDVYAESGMECTPSPIGSVLLSPPLVDNECWVSERRARTLKRTCPVAVDRLFDAQARYPMGPLSSTECCRLAPRKMAYACNLLAWRREMEVEVDPNCEMDPVQVYLFTALLGMSTAKSRLARFRLIKGADRRIEGDAYALLGYSPDAITGIFSEKPPHLSCDYRGVVFHVIA